MILIDALNIHDGGGFVLLDYLLNYLKTSRIKFFLLKDERLNIDLNIFEEDFLEGNFFKRKKIYKMVLNDKSFSCVLCLGNFPPPLGINNAKVTTYVQNAYIVDKNFEGFKNHFKNKYFQFYINNSNNYVFQTSLIKKIFNDIYVKNNKILFSTLVLPFYDQEKIKFLKEQLDLLNLVKKNGFIYNSLPHLHKNHLRLLDAWEILFDKGISPELTLTIPEKFNNKVTFRMEKLLDKGLKIKNVGYVNHEESLKLVYENNYSIFPSLKETVGLGLVEAAIMGSYILCSDLPYVYEVVKPSMTFDPLNTLSIVNAVKKAIDEELPKTELKIFNQIEELVELLVS